MRTSLVDRFNTSDVLQDVNVAVNKGMEARSVNALTDNVPHENDPAVPAARVAKKSCKN